MISFRFACMQALVALCLISSASAAKKAVIKASEIKSVNVTVKVNKKSVKSKIHCYKGVGGEAKKIKGGYTFTPYSSVIKKTKDKSKKALLKALKSASVQACAAGSGVGQGSYLSMAPYTGPFGEEQARTLLDRFAFGASPARIQQAVQDGLALTIQKLTTYENEPALDVIEANMRCNGLMPGDPLNGTPGYTCDPNDPNDLDMGGTQRAMALRHWYSKNGFYEKLFFFLHDRFMSVNTRVLGGDRYWAVNPYIDLVRRAARTGDYVQYLRDFATDYFGAITWLHLEDSTYGFNGAIGHPNEDFAREILQLGGTGAFNLDGSPVYGDFDVAQNALALTGWISECFHGVNDHWTCVPAFSRQLHANGPQRIFIGTPYESIVYDADDVVDAIARHPRLAERLAENIFDEFINPFATPDAIRALAAIIREKKHNLVDSLKVVMASKALYATQSQKSLIKQPEEYLIGFLKTTGLPITHGYWYFYTLFTNLGQLDLDPGTVFGWTNRDGLSGDSYVLPRRNAIISLLNQDIEKLEAKNFRYWDTFLQGIPSDGTASSKFIDRLVSWFGVHLNDSQRATLDYYLNYDQHECNQWTDCENGQEYYFLRRVFDPAIDSEREGRGSYSNKTRGAIAMLAMTDEYMMK